MAPLPIVAVFKWNSTAAFARYSAPYDLTPADLRLSEWNGEISRKKTSKPGRWGRVADAYKLGQTEQLPRREIVEWGIRKTEQGQQERS
ncbi:Hypothetical protein NTJ_01727 [Nesidiocoris tenuis]|uniref:Uncharacterized protein n=1 Tax=Nesidiocoris tenuis TaxID=355587 RepID=A0ABN7ADI2_9HEMI|nr:Hypothetical protein NTJ_01727 [Nesidiocoris tenuis]